MEYEGLKGDYRVVKYVFGPEPKDKEVEVFVNCKLQALIKKNDLKIASDNAFLVQAKPEKRLNPKKMQRKINKEKRKPVLSTKVQVTMQENREKAKLARKKRTKENKELQKEKKFQLKQEKRKEKKKGH
ncbi:YjdF family protein [Bombilactobacillus folatiphilus]|uniref:YjdF family protein n=1 Tax=Bombilactobacillus folatiphilus TaxID=2923362 RepID=A0ABY4PBF9_9LACO|nr:YjdF family protein [Bombilactobacillus folatiphilus]UQS82935.1 YjdF family protein [Bombilactobacillus folatiphilus]